MSGTSDLWRRLDRIRDLPTLPAVAMKINRLLEDPEAAVQSVSALIEQDQALTPRLLKLVNSSFFGLQAQVVSIRRAVVLLGFNQVRNAVYAVSVLESVGQASVEAEKLWRHGAAVAATTQYLAGHAAPHKREDAFTAGLLHDIGKFVLWRHFPEIYRRDLARAAGAARPPRGMETDGGDFGHAEVGAYLAHHWQLPGTLRDAIRHHHEPSAANGDGDLAALVHVADLAVHRMDPAAPAGPTVLADPALGKVFRAWLEAPQAWLPDVIEQIEAASQFFGKECA